MKHTILAIILLIFTSNCYASSIAIEFQENGKFTGIIGKAFLKSNSIEVVTFAEFNDEIIPFAWIYKILESKESSKGIKTIKCQNQLGVISTGVIDNSNPYKTKIQITSDNGVSITNISSAGIAMKEKYIPAVNLGN